MTSRDLVSCVHRVVLEILRFLRIGYDAYQVTACWATVLARRAAVGASLLADNPLRSDPHAPRALGQNAAWLPLTGCFTASGLCSTGAV